MRNLLTYNTRPARLAELTTGILCVSFPELGVLLRGRVRRHSFEASTGIREGRYRQQDAAFPNLRPRGFMWTSGIAATSSHSRRVGGWAGTTTVASARSDGDGRWHQHVEMDELNLIDRPANAVIIESSRGLQPHPGGSPSDIEVTREVKVDLDTID